MLSDDKDLKPSDIQVLSSAETIAAFFSSLGWNADSKSGARIKQSASALAITPDAIARTIKHTERIADQENGELQVYFFELTSVTVAAVRALARAFKDRAGKYLLVLTSDYETIDFVFLERVLPSVKDPGIATKGVTVRPHILTVKRRNPGQIALRVLRRFSYTEADADAQADKLLSAFGVAEWSERLFNNRALFSDYYLMERLPQLPEWGTQVKSQLIKFRELYGSVREKFSNQKEAVVREKLMQPVFELLGFSFVGGKDSKSVDAEPDYRLYQKDAGSSGKPIAVSLAYTWNRYLDGKDETRDTETPDENPGAHVVTLLEAGESGWAIVTNGKIWRLYSSKAHSRATNYYEIDLEETLAMQDPQEAFRFFWLFFRAQAFVPIEETYKGEKRITTFLDRLIEESETYAKELGEKLKSRVFDDIFPHFAEGFIENMGGAEYFLSLNEEEREQKLRDVFQGTLTFLYRLLFLLYSESRNLLPVTEVRGYWDISLSRIKREVAEHAGTIIDEAPEKIKKAYQSDGTELYSRLFKLFSVIDEGGPDVNVPFYNGGLFITNPANDDESAETRNAKFLRTHKIPDKYLALGLDMMARDEDAKRHDLVFIDYKSLGVRHLGSIYEGLLEFKLRIAEEKMAVVKGKKTEEIVSYKEAKKNDLAIMTKGRGKNAEERVVKKGTVYLENDKRERKATGSYYTPDYIVKYIVENTVGPVLAEKLDALRPKLREAQAAYHKAVKNQESFIKQGMKGDDPAKTVNTYRQLVDDIFDIKVLDPAMGSGHFLVEAVDFISDKILGDKEGFLRAFPWNPITAELQNTRQTILNEMEKQGVSIDRNKLTDVNLLKRHILKRCIYGVDLNPMAVELAKVSLWLDCFTLGAPLSFLDHHLKCGNSLIGAKVEEVRAAVETGQLSLLGGTHFQGLLLATDLMRHIGELSDVTAEQVKNSRAEFKKAADALAPFKRYMDVYVSQWFGNESRITGKRNKGATEVRPALEFLRSKESEEWAKIPSKVKLPTEWKSIAATALAAADIKRFFHWELEFPEVFFGPRAGATQKIEMKEIPGFDAVVGNPPYGYRMIPSAQDKKFFSEQFESHQYDFENYIYFTELGHKLLSQKGNHGFIIPHTFLTAVNIEAFRKYLLKHNAVREIFYLGLGVFEGVLLESVILLLNKKIEQKPITVKLLNKVADIPKSPVRTKDHQISREQFGAQPNYTFNILVDSEKAPVISKMLKMSIQLESISYVTVGINTGYIKEELVSNKKIDNRYHQMLNGKDIGRYEITWQGEWICYDPDFVNAFGDRGRTLPPEYIFTKPKILLQRTRRGLDTKLIAAYDDFKYYNLNRLSNVVLHDDCGYDTAYVTALLNSKLLDKYFNWVFNEYEVKPAHLRQLPIRRVFFTTPLKERQTSKQQLISNYNAVNMDEGRIVVSIENILLNDREGFLTAVKDRKREYIDKSDIIQDFLSFLAIQMTDASRSLQKEQARFLGWLVKALKINGDEGKDAIGTFSGKGILLNYAGAYQKREQPVTFNALWDVLLKNKNRFGRSTDTQLQSRIREEYEKSVSILLPIVQKLTVTDHLIDQIVYRLYGLTDEEIAVIEEHQSH